MCNKWLKLCHKSCSATLLQAKTGAAEDTGRLQGDPVAMKRAESIVKALQLKPMQGQTLAWIRERQLKKVAALAKARRDLSMQVRQCLLIRSPDLS